MTKRIDELDTTDAWEWDVLTTFHGVLWWWQPGKPKPTPEQAAEAKRRPDFAAVALDDLEVAGARDGDTITVVSGQATMRSWAEVCAGRQAAWAKGLIPRTGCA